MLSPSHGWPFGVPPAAVSIEVPGRIAFLLVRCRQPARSPARGSQDRTPTPKTTCSRPCSLRRPVRATRRAPTRVALGGSDAAGSPDASCSSGSPWPHRVERAAAGNGLARRGRGARSSPRRGGRCRRAGGRVRGRDRVEPAAPGIADGRSLGESGRYRAAARRPRRRTAGGPVGGAHRGRDRRTMARGVAPMAERAAQPGAGGSRDAARTERPGRRGSGRAHL